LTTPQVTRRATYVAEENVAKLETAKKEQDYLIDGLQETLKQLHQQLQLYEAQHAAQQAETHAARSTLKEAEAEMEAIHFEKKQLVQQWKSSLIGITRRDEALQATEAALRAQHEQEASIVTEMQGYRRALKEVQAHNEQVSITQPPSVVAHWIKLRLAPRHIRGSQWLPRSVRKGPVSSLLVQRCTLPTEPHRRTATAVLSACTASFHKHGAVGACIHQHWQPQRTHTYGVRTPPGLYC
jgi:hypothetical protein